MRESLLVQGSRDCPCPGIFKAVAYCDDCPYRTAAGIAAMADDPDEGDGFVVEDGSDV